MLEVLETRDLNAPERVLLSCYLRHILFIEETRGLAPYQGPFSAPAPPPPLMSEAEFVAVLAEDRKGTDWVKVGGFVLGAAALVSGLGAVGAAAGAALGGGLVGGAADSALTQAVSDVAVNAAQGHAVSESRAQTLLHQWRQVGPIPETYAAHKRMHADALRSHERFIRAQEALKRRYEARAQRVNVLLPKQAPVEHFPRWGLQVLGAVSCLVTGAGLNDYALRYWQSDALAFWAAAPFFVWALSLLIKGWTGRKALSWAEGSQKALLSFHPRYTNPL